MYVLDESMLAIEDPAALASTVVTVGRLPAALAGTIRKAVARTGGTVSFQATSAGARHELVGGHVRPRCVLVDESVADFAGLVEWLRNDAGLFDIPVIALVAAPTEQEFAVARSSGADDVVLREDWAAVTRRVAALDCFVPGEQPLAVRGTALVAHPEPGVRRRLGWILRRAGYDLAFSGSRLELGTTATTRRPQLLVVASSLLQPETAPEATARLRRDLGSDRLPIVVLTTNDQDATDFAGLPHTAAAPDAGGWEHLLFQVGELTRPDVTDLRSSPRTYCSAFCTFRQRTAFQPVYAITYNVSRGGMFVRTMDPPRSQSEVSIELRATDGEREVLQLRGHVVWVQQPLHGSTGATPAGFGVRLQPEACGPQDLERYQSMCDALHAEQFPERASEAAG